MYKKPITVKNAYVIKNTSFANIAALTQELKKQCQTALYHTYCRTIASTTCHLIDYRTLRDKNPIQAEQLQSTMTEYITNTLKEGLTSPMDHRHITSEELFTHIQTTYLPIYRLAMQSVMYQAKQAQLICDHENQLNPENRIILFPADNKILCIVQGYTLSNKIMPNIIAINKPNQFDHYEIQNYDYHYDKKPNGISDEDYEQRYKDWTSTMKTSNPKDNGIVIELSDYDKLASTLYFLQPSELMKYMKIINRTHFFEQNLFKSQIHKLIQPPCDFCILTEITQNTLMEQTKDFIPKLM